MPVVQPAGATTARCSLSSRGSTQDIVCFGAGSAGLPFVDAQFSGMFMEQGRAGKRFGAVHSTFASVSRNSTGSSNTVTALGGGSYRVTFANLGRPAGAKETVLVATQALFSSVHCNPSGWTTVVTDLVVDVVCFNGAGGAPIGQEIIVVVIE